MKRRLGYSILELMIALALLGGLLATSWSLLETYRKAEQQSWDLVDRTEAARVATQWLENDILHLDIVENNSSSIETASNPTSFSRSVTLTRTHNLSAKLLSPPKAYGLKTRFTGNSQGFRAMIVPSLDPAPWMERLFENNGENTSELSDLPSPSSMARQLENSETIRRPVVLASVEISYELSLTGESAQSSQQSISVFDLVRRERVSQDQLPQDLDYSANEANEPILDAQDLYRQTDEPTTDDGLIIRENSIHGLADAAFWYFDGATWLQSWKSSDGSLPVAVALVCDFAPRQGVQPIAKLLEVQSSPSDRMSFDSPRDTNRIDQVEPFLQDAGENFEMIQKDIKLVFQTPKRSVSNPNLRGNTQQFQSFIGTKP